MSSAHGHGVLLAFDFGSRRIGVASGQMITCTATPLRTLHARNNGPDWTSISQLINEWQPDALIVGLPLSLDGNETDMSAAARRFGNQLHGRYNLPVHWIQEQLSSHEAEQRQTGAGQHGKTELDSIAAQVILETWMTQQQHGEQDG